MSRLIKYGVIAVLISTVLACAPRNEPEVYVVKTQTVAERLIDNLMRDFGFSKVQAAGIVGNLAQESGQFHTLQEVGGGCFGYSQWCGVRKTEFFQFAHTTGGKHSFRANYSFLRHEMRRDYPKMIEQIRTTKTVEGSAKIFMNVFLRPNRQLANLPRRISYGRSYARNNYAGSAMYHSQ